MYLVEIETGREEVFQSVESLASAIRRGEVGPRSRIFHRASSTWVSITVHPEYRKAAADRAGEPLPPLARKQWTFYAVEPASTELEESSETADVGTQEAPRESGARRSFRGLIGRALRSLVANPKPSELADT
jgi:hypothetical protein